MSEHIVEQYPNIENNQVLSYQVDIINRTLCILTKSADGKSHIEIIFTGVLSHRFEDVILSNLLYEISQFTIDYFIAANKEVINESLEYGYPAQKMDNIGALKDFLKKEKYKIFDITSTLGLCGEVIAKEISIEIKK